MTKQLHKLINVLKIRDLDPADAVAAELLLVRVAGEGEKRTEALQIAEIFNAKIVDVDRRSLTLRVVGANDKLEALLELLQPLGVLEVVRTGTIAMGRGSGLGRERLGGPPPTAVTLRRRLGQAPARARHQQMTTPPALCVVGAPRGGPDDRRDPHPRLAGGVPPRLVHRRP